jgi:hypothetical protein
VLWPLPCALNHRAILSRRNRHSTRHVIEIRTRVNKNGDWQTLYYDAVVELDLVQLLQKIEAAQRAIGDKLRPRRDQRFLPENLWVQRWSGQQRSNVVRDRPPFGNESSLGRKRAQVYSCAQSWNQDRSQAAILYLPPNNGGCTHQPQQGYITVLRPLGRRWRRGQESIPGPEIRNQGKDSFWLGPA